MSAPDIAYKHIDGLGYRRDLEDTTKLLANAASNAVMTCGDVDPKGLGAPIGMEKYLKLENQLQINSCAGNSLTTVAEGCIWHSSQGQMNPQLSRMFCYVNGQRHCGISGDSGATLQGCLEGASTEGIPLEEDAPYTGSYYTQFSARAQQNARNYLIGKDYAPVTDVDQVYEGLAKRLGGLYAGLCWNGQFQQPLANGYVDRYTEQRGYGWHAICFMDWCNELDEKGYPRLKMFNSHGLRYGDNGISKWSRDALQDAIHGPNSTVFFVYHTNYKRNKYDWAKAHWTAA